MSPQRSPRRARAPAIALALALLAIVPAAGIAAAQSGEPDTPGYQPRPEMRVSISLDVDRVELERGTPQRVGYTLRNEGAVPVDVVVTASGRAVDVTPTETRHHLDVNATALGHLTLVAGDRASLFDLIRVEARIVSPDGGIGGIALLTAHLPPMLRTIEMPPIDFRPLPPMEPPMRATPREPARCGGLLWELSLSLFRIRLPSCPIPVAPMQPEPAFPIYGERPQPLYPIRGGHPDPIVVCSPVVRPCWEPVTPCPTQPTYGTPATQLDARSLLAGGRIVGDELVITLDADVRARVQAFLDGEAR